MAGYVSEFTTGAAIEAILKKANSSQSVSQSEKTTWNNKQNALTFDTTPTEGSTNPVTSDGVYKLTAKTLTYTGDGLTTTTITFPNTPIVILSIDGPGTGTGMVSLSSFRFGANAVSGSWSDNEIGSTGSIALRADYSENSLLLTGGQNVGARCNIDGETYTVIYI